MAGEEMGLLYLDISGHPPRTSALEEVTGAIQWVYGQWTFLLLACLALLALGLLFHCRTTGLKEKSDMIVLFSLAKTAYKRKHMDTLMNMLTKSRKSWNNHREPATGLTLFLCSCLSGQRKLVECLLSKGANINSVSSGGDTALILATYACCTVKGADPAILDLLACRGVDVNARNDNGNSPLSIAAIYGRTDLLSMLLQYGANANVAGKTGCSPVDFAAYCGSEESIKLLNEQGPKEK